MSYAPLPYNSLMWRCLILGTSLFVSHWQSVYLFKSGHFLSIGFIDDCSEQLFPNLCLEGWKWGEMASNSLIQIHNSGPSPSEIITRRWNKLIWTMLADTTTTISIATSLQINSRPISPRSKHTPSSQPFLVPNTVAPIVETNYQSTSW